MPDLSCTKTSVPPASTREIPPSAASNATASSIDVGASNLISDRSSANVERGARRDGAEEGPEDEPTADAEAFRRKLDEDYTNREGFQVRFVPGFRTKFPRLSTKHRRRAAKNEEARDGDDPFLLPYEHFSVVVEGVHIERGAVLAAQVVLTSSTPIVDVTGPEEKISKGRVPARAVVIPGSRAREFPAGTYQVPCALIAGWRSESTDRKTALEQALRTHGPR